MFLFCFLLCFVFFQFLVALLSRQIFKIKSIIKNLISNYFRINSTKLFLYMLMYNLVYFKFHKNNFSPEPIVSPKFIKINILLPIYALNCDLNSNCFCNCKFESQLCARLDSSARRGWAYKHSSPMYSPWLNPTIFVLFR